MRSRRWRTSIHRGWSNFRSDICSEIGQSLVPWSLVLRPFVQGPGTRDLGLGTEGRGTDNVPMAARPTWKGFLKISLVNIPVRVFPATDSAATISFNQLHAECQTRIQQKRWCPTCDREVPMSEIAKGYEFEKGRYVVMTEEDVAKVRPESTRVIDLVQFTDVAAIDPIYIERPYYLAPDGAMAAEAFAVMREGMKGKAGIGKLALYGREYLVAVQPREKGLVMDTMRHANEVRSMDNIEELDSVPSKVKPDEIKL